MAMKIDPGGGGSAPSKPAAKAKAKSSGHTGTRPVSDPESKSRVLGAGGGLVRNAPAPQPQRYNPSKPAAPTYTPPPKAAPVTPAPPVTTERGRPTPPSPVGTAADPNSRPRPQPAAAPEGAPQYAPSSRGRPVELPDKATPAVLLSGGAPPIPTDGVIKLLNEQNWKMPAQKQRVSMPDKAFSKSGVDDLAEHDYEITNEEWERLKNTYGTKEAKALGYEPPQATNVDDNTPLMHLGPQESAALTWDAYQDLSKGQRAAVDFNTLLVQAREKDLDKPITLEGVDKDSYDQRVEKMFGAGHGSDTVAPATMNLLGKLDMDLVGQDLDEYLSLERAVDATELGDFKFSKGDVKTIDQMVNGKAPTYAEVRTPENIGAIDTAAIQKTQQMIKTALQNPDALTYDFNTLVNGPTAQMQESGPKIGFGDETTQWTNPHDAEMDGWFRTAREVLNAKNPSKYGVPAGADTMNWLLADMPNLKGYNKDSPQQFLNYIQGQDQLMSQYGTTKQAKQAQLVDQRAGLGG
jgi:hypothetical protein